MEQLFDNKYLKTKIKSYIGEIRTNFNGKVTKKGFKCICLSAIVIDSVFKSGKNYYSQKFLAECKYKTKEKEKKGSITGDIECSSSYDDLGGRF